MIDIPPWSKRNSEPEPRIHETLNAPARKRIAHTLTFVHEEDVRASYDRLVEFTGKDPDHLRSPKLNLVQSQYQFLVQEENQDIVLDYLQYLLNRLWRNKTMTASYSKYVHDEDKLINACYKIEKALIEEGILIQMKPSPSEEMSSDKWTRSDYDKIIFQQLSDETIIESDQELRVLALGDTWKDPLSGYNEAWQLYKNGTFTYAIPEKLYNSIEAVCKEICIEQEGWLDEGTGVGACISELQDHDLFKPNDEMVAEWQKIASGIQIGVQRTGGDRKRHEKIDQDYIVMILHQVSSFLTFVIKRYEKNRYIE
jgi:hypothetical protein